MGVLNYLTLLAAVANLSLGLLVISRGVKKPLFISFFVFALFDAVWAYTNFHFSAINADLIIFKSQYAFGAVMLASALFWIIYLTGEQASKLKMMLITVLGAVFLILPYCGDLIIKSIIPLGNQQFDFQTGKLFDLYSISLLITLLYLLFNLSKSYKSAVGIKKMQLRYVLTGLGIFSTITIMFGVVLPLFNIKPVVAFDAQSSLIWVALTAYAIIAHQLFDIRLIIKRTVVYSGLLLFTLIIYSLIVFLFTAVFGGANAFEAKVFLENLLAAMVIAIGFEPIRSYLTRVTDKYLFKGEYDPQAVLAELSQKLSSSLDIREASQSLIMTIKSQMRLKNAALVTFVTDEGITTTKESIQDGYANPAVLQLSNESPLLRQYAQAPQLLFTEMLKREVETIPVTSPTLPGYTALLDELTRLEIAVALPIVVDNKAIGVFMVGPKLSGDSFSKNELEFLTIVASQTTNTIQKSRFWEEDQMKSEFVSIASHELLTPTAAIKGYLSMILDDNMGEIDEKARGFLVKVYNSSDRLAKLVEDLLNVSRIESGRFKINKRAFNLVESVQKASDELQVNAKKKNLDMAFVAPESALPTVYADPDHIYRVLINLIGNSVKYTPQGWVRCFVTQADTEHLLFAVSDSGLGIPKDSIPHLFEKFYRADRRDIAGIQGTGLGLYISKKIIDMMGGQLWVESEVGKGTTFYFTVPICTVAQVQETAALQQSQAAASAAEPVVATAPIPAPAASVNAVIPQKVQA